MNEPDQIEMFPTALRLQRNDPDRDTRHFYFMTVQPDLFGGAALVKEWGPVGALGQISSVPFPDEGQAVDALAQVAKAKARRGYVIAL